MKKNKFLEKFYIKAKLKLLSPLLLGSGEDENTNIDIIRDWEGKPFLPGHSIAGAVRYYINEIISENTENELVKDLFGEKGKNSTQSIIIFHDALAEEYKIQIRDGVKIDNLTKTAKNEEKYNYEIIEKNSVFNFRLELHLRESHIKQKEKFEYLLYLILNCLSKGQITLGGKKKRGCGKIKLEELELIKFDFTLKKDIEQWINFDWNKFNKNFGINDLLNNITKFNDLEIKEINKTQIIVNFKMLYPIIIKTYSDNPDVEDMEHIFSAGKPIISGTSWTGALRHAIENIGKEIGKRDIFLNLTDKLFGFVCKESKKAQASKIIISETIINKTTSNCYTRNRIDRFSGGTVEGALFDEKPIFPKNNTNFDLIIEIKEPEDYEIGIIILAIQELWHGIQSIGGNVNIGRGVLQGNGLRITEITEKIKKSPIIIFEPNGCLLKKYYDALYKKILECEGKDCE